MLSNETIEKISQGNIRHHQKKLAAFLAADPHCKKCNEPLSSYSRTGVCIRCQKEINSKNFREKNPGYWNRYYENGKA